MMQPDLNIWGWLAMPVGVLFCFGPVLVVWAIAGFGSETPELANLPEKSETPK